MKIILSLLFAGISLSSWAQYEIRGLVLDQAGNRLPLANLYIPSLEQGGVADTNGAFRIKVNSGKPPVTVIASFIGYSADTLTYRGFPLSFTLSNGEVLGEVTVEEERQLEYSFLEERSTETINLGELRKAACCNLSESFETNPSVNVAFTDAVTGTKRIRMLGLDGAYSQILLSGNPLLIGPEVANGISTVPGPWITSLQLIKGPGSIVQGSESMTGQINLSIPNAELDDSWLIDLFGSTNSRAEANLVAPVKLKNGYRNLLMAHMGSFSLVNDQNKDGFLDAPLRRSYGVFDEFNKEADHLKFHGAFGYLSEFIEGGTVSAVNESSGSPYYNVNHDREKMFGWVKAGYVFDKPGTSLGWINQYNSSSQDAKQGLTGLRYTFKNLQSRLLFASFLGNTNHTYTLGLDVQRTEYEDVFIPGGFLPIFTSDFGRNQAGGFAEYTYTHSEALSLVTGLRYNQFEGDGGIVLPRFNLRYNPNAQTVLRFNLGRGARYAYGLAENLSMLASNRLVQSELPEIGLEKSWNIGAAIARRANIAGKGLESRLEGYYTLMEAQLVASRETPGEINFIWANQGRAASVLFANTLTLTNQFKYNASVQWTQNMVDYPEGYMQAALIPQWRFLHGIDWSNPLKTWEVNVTAQHIGRSRMPVLAPGVEVKTPEPFSIVQFQVTRVLKWAEFYIGMNNVLNYTQENPILLSGNPQDPNFDAGLVWGPLQGRRVYGGIRIELNPFEK